MKPLVTYITMAGRVSTDLVDILFTFTYTTHIYLGNKMGLSWATLNFQTAILIDNS